MVTSCNRGPKVIAPSEPDGSEQGTGIFSADASTPVPEESQHLDEGGVHSVVVMEILPTARYVYLRVKEDSDEFWIATIKREIEVGKTYFYRDGLLKTNFESKEHNRVFDRMYLVSTLVEHDHGDHASSLESESSQPVIDGNIDVKGSIKIAELVANPKKYEGKVIQISGKCVKVNSNIMGRNWIHLKDGSKDDFDLVITCSSAVHEGHIVTMIGKVALNKDFGAGYQYPIILEEGEFVQ
jgi:hypothetical protein